MNRFDAHFRGVVKDQVEAVAKEMFLWQGQPYLQEAAKEAIRERIVFFEHTTKRTDLRVGGVDGSGDFPSLAYEDAAVFFSLAHGVIYESASDTGLKELPLLVDPVVHVTWVPEDEHKRSEMLLAAFAELAGRPVREVIAKSDYRKIRASIGGRPVDVPELLDGLILPHPTDTGNLAIQLRSSAELGAALRLICSHQKPKYVLVDTTFSLPLVSQSGSLFFEHLKRLCCVEAVERGVGFFALSKSHGLAGVEMIELLAKERLTDSPSPIAQHWYLRLPVPGQDEWDYASPAGKRIPPHGAVSYLFRLHRNTPVMRLDVDFVYWQKCINQESDAETQSREKKIFADIDYTSHDQRAYGYPYSIKACHDRTSMTRAERVALRNQIIDAAVKAGMRRSLFKDVSVATGHA